MSGAKKIAILGGGVGSMVTAWELSHSGQPFELTVYQMGWRLGGKGASGRNLDPAYHARIEEHGVHVWSGLYDNAFRVIREAYAEAGRAPDAPLGTWRDAFKPHDFIVLEEEWKGRWIPWPIRLPTNPELPGEPDPTLLPSLPALAVEAMRAIGELVQAAMHPEESRLADKTGEPFLPLEGMKESMAGKALEKFLLFLAEGLTEGLLPVWQLGLELLSLVLDGVWELVKDRLDETALRRFWIMLNFSFANLRGSFEENVFERGFDVLDAQDYRAWLAKYAVDDGGLTVNSPWAYFMYDAEFAYVDGDISKPNIGAGSSLRTLLRMAFTWKGALLWKMQAGMGDTIFAPLYEVLARRGVRFEFFHRIEALHLSSDGKRIERMDVGIQARTKNGVSYDPLVTVKGLACWPSTTLWEQIEEPKDHSINFEDPESPVLKTKTLQLGTDFDAVVLGIPVAALPALTLELKQQSTAWASMLEQVKTVRTQALQLWLTRTSYELGWTLMGRPLLATFHASPLNTWADMTHLDPREAWPWQKDRAPLSIAYFCGPMAEGDDPKRMVKETSLDLLRKRIGWLWPEATTPPRTIDAPLDWNLLIDDRSTPGKGEERLDAQYLRANYWPSERFTLTVAGSTQWRLAPGNSGFENLFLAGDWTENGFNIGNVEATVMSGMLASNAISGYPKREHIVGVDFGRSPK